MRVCDNSIYFLIVHSCAVLPHQGKGMSKRLSTFVCKQLVEWIDFVTCDEMCYVLMIGDMQHAAHITVHTLGLSCKDPLSDVELFILHLFC